MSERDELAELLAAAYGESPSSADDDAADAILAAGYRKPRTIETFEDLDALPEGSIILPRFGRTWRRGLVSWDNGIYRWSSESIAAHGAIPATVLYEGATQ